MRWQCDEEALELRVHWKTKWVIVRALTLFLLSGLVMSPVMLPEIALADYSVRPVNPSHSPVEISNCRITGSYAATPLNFYASVRNRARYELLVFTVQLIAYDSDNANIGSVTLSFNEVPAGIPGSSYPVNQNGPLGLNLSEPPQALAYFRCWIAAASFTGLHTWAFGQRWPGMLLPP